MDLFRHRTGISKATTGLLSLTVQQFEVMRGAMPQLAISFCVGVNFFQFDIFGAAFRAGIDLEGRPHNAGPCIFTCDAGRGRRN